jgi:hypothetical protein
VNWGVFGCDGRVQGRAGRSGVVGVDVVGLQGIEAERVGGAAGRCGHVHHHHIGSTDICYKPFLGLSAIHKTCTTAEYLQQNNDYKHGFHDFSLFSLNVY